MDGLVLILEIANFYTLLFSKLYFVAVVKAHLLSVPAVLKYCISFFLCKCQSSIVRNVSLEKNTLK